MKSVGLISFVVATAVAVPGTSDPRWWTHDRAVTRGLDAKTNPDVHIVDGQATAGVAPILVTWEQASSAGLTDIYIDASFDGGCTWCGPVLWAGSPGAETAPRIAAGNTPSNRLSIQVVFVRGNQVLVASDATLSSFQSADVLCRSFAALRTPTALVLTTAPAVARPRITVTSRLGGLLHFHALWQEDIGPSSRMRYDHDLAGDGSGWGPGLIDLTAAINEPGFDPDIASDSLARTNTDTAVTIFYRGAIDAIYMSRSIDSGATWSQPGVRVSDLAKQAFPVVDASSSPFGDAQVWNGGAYHSVSSPSVVGFDAAYWTAPLTRVPDFDPGPDVIASNPPDSPGIDLAVALPPASPGSAAGSSAFVFWGRAGSPGEIVSRAATLNPNDPTPRNLDLYPIPALRVAPPDPVLSTVNPHSNCAWDDDWPALASGTSVPLARPAGSAAVQVAAADAVSLGGVTPTLATVFADDRSGVSQIYFKQLDGNVGTPSLTSVSSGCAAIRQARVDVVFPLLRECPLGNERIARYLIYYGSETSEGASANGPFVNRFEVANVGLSDPTTVTISSLRPGEVYHFAIVAEDEARNLAPQNFDPRAVNTGLVLSQKISRVITAPCSPDLRLVGCAPGPDDCGGNSDGIYNPGETFPVSLFFRNFGDLPATLVQGAAAAIGATVLAPATFTIPTIAVATTEFAFVTLRLPLTCPPAAGEPSLTASVTSDSGVVDYGILSCPMAPLVATDCSSSCMSATCIAGNLSELRDLKGIKNGTGGASFSWLPDADPFVSEYHLNSVTDKLDIANAHLPLLGIGNPECVSIAPATGCDDPNALGAGPRIFYQVYSACGPSDADEGP